MPLTKSGSYQANPAVAAMHDNAAAAPVADTAAAPQANTITLTRDPQGFSVQEDNGAISQHPDFQSAMDYAANCFGEPTAGAAPAEDSGDAGESNEGTDVDDEC